ncbi:MAG: PHP domain-containing protein [Clostridia bacterium]|nr:PHP domain-containing protein [Clostridia bacterium]
MYIYEMHQHTAPCSACGRGDPAETVRALKKAGFAGMVLTNHFIGGNTGIDRNLPWDEFVRCYENDYLAAKKAGEEEDFDVIFGIEEHIGNGKEVLLYGITPEFLYAHPELRNHELETISRLVREFGGLVFQAHPYRDRSYVTNPNENLPIEFLDGFETYNVCNKGDENIRAEAYAEKNGLLISAGSDAHAENQDVRYGIACNRRIADSFELAQMLKSGDYKLYLGE